MLQQSTHLILVSLFIICTSYAQSLISIPIQQKKINFSEQRFLSQKDQNIEIFSDQEKYKYYTKIKIGKNEQPYKFLIDTGSNVFWVTSTKCNNCKGFYEHQYNCVNQDNCQITNQDNGINYQDGTQVKGKEATMPIKIGSYYLQKQSFLLVLETKSPLVKFGCDGLLGLGIYDEKHPESFNLVQQLFLQKQIPFPQFSIHLATSMLTLGGYDTQYMRDPDFINYHNVISTNDWSIAASKVTFGSSISSPQNTVYKALVDTGAVQIYLPPNIFQNIRKYLLKNYYAQEKDNSIIVACEYVSVLPSLTFYFPDINNQIKEYSVLPSFYLKVIPDGRGYCHFFVRESKYEDKIILGTDFLKRFVSIFSYVPFQIGLAESKYTPPPLKSINYDEEKNESENSNLNESEFPGWVIALIVIFSFLFAILVVYLIFSTSKKKRIQQLPQNDDVCRVQQQPQNDDVCSIKTNHTPYLDK